MNIWIASVIWAAVVVVAGVLMSKLFIRLWNFACPHVPQAPRSPLPQDRTTDAAAKMTGAALDIEQRLYEADSIGCLLEQDELLQLEQARARLDSAIWMLDLYQARYAPPTTQHSATPSLQHSNS